MDLYDILSMIGGLSIFLFGMSIMGAALEKRAGGSLKNILGKLTGSRLGGLMTGMAVTAVIQSSSAATVMVVGFVNSGLMTLSQAINVIMGANVGTTVTAWLLSLSGIGGGSLLVNLLKPSSFTPVLAFIGIILYMTQKGKRKDTGTILLGFATLMFGMEAMSSAVAGLKDVPAFTNIMIMFSNPLLGVAAGALLTAVIQSSSASVGILQALASTGKVTAGAAIPIIMGQNIGTCFTALLSSVGASKNARRAAVVHLCFNVLGTLVWLTVFCAANAVFDLSFTALPATQFSIAVIHSVFNVLCTALMLPLAGFLERLACRLVPDTKEASRTSDLDERLMTTPAVAIAQCHAYASEMAASAFDSMDKAVGLLLKYDKGIAEAVRSAEKDCDHMEDTLGSYLVKLSTRELNTADSIESAKLLHVISDLERISDYAVSIVIASEEMREKDVIFSDSAKKDIAIITDALRDINAAARQAFITNDIGAAIGVEPLEHVISGLKEQIRARHIQRLQNGGCSIPAGFVLTDILTEMDRTAGHCSNIAGCVLEMSSDTLDLHNYLSGVRTRSTAYEELLTVYEAKYTLPAFED